jgi:ParB family chromosome partitioning protein
MNDQQIELLPIAEINVPNPRPRNKLVFELIVANIGAVGLKRPITVSRRETSGDDDNGARKERTDLGSRVR